MPEERRSQLYAYLNCLGLCIGDLNYKQYISFCDGMMSESTIEVEGATSSLFEAIYRQQPRGYQYIETNVLRFTSIFSLLRINVLYMFRALLAPPQEALHSVTWYIACVLCQLAAPGLECTKCRLCSASGG
jgi:hypothetical protein